MKRILLSLLAMMMVIAVTGCGSDDSDAELDAYAAAARVFNSNASVTSRYATLLGNDQIGNVYASIGLAEDYPDQVLVTVSIPQIDAAKQYLFDPASPTANLGASDVDSDTLPESVKEWNATFDDEGHLLVTGREQESLP